MRISGASATKMTALALGQRTTTGAQLMVVALCWRTLVLHCITHAYTIGFVPAINYYKFLLIDLSHSAIVARALWT